MFDIVVMQLECKEFGFIELNLLDIFFELFVEFVFLFILEEVLQDVIFFFKLFQEVVLVVVDVKEEEQNLSFVDFLVLRLDDEDGDVDVFFDDEDNDV